MPFNGSRLRALRKLHGLRQEHVAQACTVAQGKVSDWERRIAEPTFAQAEQIATLLDCTMDFLGDRTFVGLDLEFAASQMSFDAFVADLSTPQDWKDHCAPIRGEPTAPLTKAKWRELAKNIALSKKLNPPIPIEQDKAG